MQLYKYQGAGNDFLIADNRRGDVHLDTDQIQRLCDRRYGIGADGVMLLESVGDPAYDFRMVYYNSDGSGGMMCGNGGRCIVAFAHYCGLRSYRFLAADGLHVAEIIAENGLTLIVKLKMVDVEGIDVHPELNAYFLDTGTRHLVCPVVSLSTYDVMGEGARLRYLPKFGPIGVNVNFVERKDHTLWVRTYEKGVEAETYACGTGITASAIADWHISHPNAQSGVKVHTDIRALRDDLSVDFVSTPTGARDVYLTGPATFVAEVICP